jgi:glutamate racemase
MAMVSLVVMEPGSEWPGHVGDAANLVAFSQDGERLLQKTKEKLEALRRDKQDVRVAVLACNTETGGTADGCRAQVAGTLLAAVRGPRLGASS